MDLQEKIKLGVKLLDEKIPGWRKKINLNQFDMRNCFDCVLGQLKEEYTLGLEYLNNINGIKYGFSLGWGVSADERSELQKLWVEEITSQDYTHNQ